MNSFEPHETFVYLSDWMERRVVDPDDKSAGKISDVIAHSGHLFPPIKALVIKHSGKTYRYEPIANEFRGWVLNKRLQIDPTRLSPYQIGTEEFLVRDWLWDRQIVDMSGAKVKRVNDVQLLVSDIAHIIHVDTGFLGLVRRLGFERGTVSISKLIGKRLEEELISWKYVAPIGGQSTSPLKLQVQLSSLRKLHPAELADILEDLDKDDRADVIRAVGPESAADALEVSEEEVQKSVFELLSAEESADILEEMEPQVAADVLEVVNEETAEAMLAEVEPETREDLAELAAHRDETAGSMMSTDFITCHPTDNVDEVMTKIRILAREIDNFLYVYVIDDEEKLVGICSLRSLMTSTPETTIHQIMRDRYVTVSTSDSIEEVAELFTMYEFAFCPVLDDGKMEGVISLKHAFGELLPHFWKKRND